MGCWTHGNCRYRDSVFFTCFVNSSELWSINFRLKVQLWIVHVTFPKQCLHWRGSYGVAKEGAMVPSVSHPRHASTHFCCYFTYFVHVTFTTLQPNGRFFQICCKLQYKINLFGLRWSLVPLWQVSACLGWYSDHIWVIFWPHMSKMQSLQKGHVTINEEC